MENTIGNQAALNEDKRNSTEQLRARLAQKAKQPTSKDALKKRFAERNAKRRSVGSWLKLSIQAQEQFKDNLQRQLSYLFEHGDVIPAIGRQRQASDITITAFSDTMFRSMKELNEEKATVRNVSELSKKHVLVLIKRWERTGITWKTIETRVSFIRRFLDYLNKPDVIPVRASLYIWLSLNGVKIHDTRKSRITDASKSWTSKGVNPQEIIKKVSEQDLLIGTLLELQVAFGLRIHESYCLEPRAADEGNKLVITKGTKGGRPRTVDFDVNPVINEWQRDLIERAKVLAQKHPQRRLTSPGRSDKQMRGYFNRTLVKCGVTMKELGVTSHGLRHEFAARVFTGQSGLPPQAESSMPVSEYKSKAEEVKEARLYTSEQLGHWREDITSSYLGSTPRLDKLTRQRMQSWIDRFQNNPELLNVLTNAGVQTCFIVGRAGMGLPMIPGTKLELRIKLKTLNEEAMRGLDRIKLKIQAEFGLDASIGVNTNDDTPTDALEIFMPKSVEPKAEQAV